MLARMLKRAEWTTIANAVTLNALEINPRSSLTNAVGMDYYS
jgi:hypothetical protein